MTLSDHYIRNRIAWVHPEFLAQQIEKSTKSMHKSTIPESKYNQPKCQVSTQQSQHSTVIKCSPVSTVDQAVEIESPAQTRNSPQKPTVAENLELNELKARLKSTLAEKIQLKKTTENLNQIFVNTNRQSKRAP